MTTSSMMPRVLAITLATAFALLAGCDQPKEPKRQTVKIAVLPDTPPPPPPKEEKKPEPEKQDIKPQPQEQPKLQDTPPEPQQLKMDGPAGDGPSAFAAGQVTSDYKGGEIGTGSGGSAVQRLTYMSYANAATRSINDFLNRDPTLRRADYKVAINVWVNLDGRLARAELAGSTGHADTDEALRAALKRFPGLRSAPPDQLPQPIRLQLTNRMMG